MTRIGAILCAAFLSLAAPVALAAETPGTAPTSSPTPSELRIVVTELNGKVQKRNAEDQEWSRVKVGDQLSKARNCVRRPRRRWVRRARRFVDVSSTFDRHAGTAGGVIRLTFHTIVI
jgi:hypothetical protein